MARRLQSVTWNQTVLGPKGFLMMDVIFIGATVAFFAICIVYTYACGRL